MQDHESPTRRLPLSIVAGISALILGTGGAVAWWGWNTISQRQTAPSATQRSQPIQEEPKSPQIAADPAETGQPPAKIAPAEAEKTLQVFWLKGMGNEVALTAVPVKLSSSQDSGALVEAAVKQLLAGPSNASVTTTIPRKTKLKSLSVRNDGIHIDLSEEFTQGGGTTSMTARVAQILYTATSLNPNAQVWLSVEGEPLNTLGGEGLMLDQPMTRKGFEKDFSLY
ncbi:GerMN domain-containing protein [Leptothermofonsia sp. ETS-13]|uniref:GerMN domain-containing protein n=1 Tax=Leptothermofonsia sp. ETS-13 TaxID=3035696 RepID=UPI003B9F2937